MSKGFVLWFTGLSGSGKSTLTSMVAAELRRRGVHVETLDGDEIRKHLSKGLGFSREDRDANIRRIGFVAKLIARSGGCAIAAAISPYREVRDEVRRSIDHFVEIYTECPIAVLAERDPKGLYKKALAGEIRNFTGVDDPYEAPDSPEVHLYTDREQPEESLARILGQLEQQGLIPAWGRLLDGSEPPEAGGSRLAAPHGRDLVDRTIRGESAARERERAESLPLLELDEKAAWELVALATGVYSPLAGFMTSKDYLRVVREMRLESGLPWALPVTVPCPEEREAELRRTETVALSANGRRLGVMRVEDVFRAEGRVLVGGEVRCFETPPSLGGAPWTTPAAVRGQLAKLGFSRVVAVQTASAPLASHEHLARAALAFADGLLVQPTASPGDALPIEVRVRAWEALAAGYFDRKRLLLAPHPRWSAGSAQKLAIHDAIVAKNYGASHLLVVDKSDEPRDVEDWFACYGAGELGIEVLAAAPAVFSSKIGLATTRSAPEGATRVDAEDIVNRLARGEEPDAGIVRPEVRAIIAEHTGRQHRP